MPVDFSAVAETPAPLSQLRPTSVHGVCTQVLAQAQASSLVQNRQVGNSYLPWTAVSHVLVRGGETDGCFFFFRCVTFVLPVSRPLRVVLLCSCPFPSNEKLSFVAEEMMFYCCYCFSLHLCSTSTSIRRSFCAYLFPWLTCVSWACSSLLAAPRGRCECVAPAFRHRKISVLPFSRVLTWEQWRPTAPAA